MPALRGVSLKVRHGEMVGVVGPNGAGKSTLLLTIAGVLRPTQGSVELSNESLVREVPEDIVRKGVSLVPERRHIFAQLTVEENLKVAAATRTERQKTARDLEELYERFPILGERRSSRGGNLSGGQQQQLAIARALLTRPQLLLVDEPSLGLAPLLVERVFDSLATLRDEGVSILLVEQNALATIEMSDRIYVLRRGEIALEGEGTDATIPRRYRQVLYRSTGSRRADHVGSLGVSGHKTMVVQHLVDAISLGSLYALAVLGIALILGVMKLINFAHGDLIMVGGYSMAALSPYPWPFLILGTLATTTLLALVMERTAFRPVRGASAATLLITSFTVSYLLQNIISATLTSDARPVLMPMFVLELFEIGDVRIQKLGIVTVAVTVILAAALACGLKWTSIGLHMRSAAEDFRMARLLGVRANRVIAASFAISGFLAGTVSLIFMSQIGAVVPTTGISITLVAFVGTVVGGMGNLTAATAGGFLLGVMTVVLQVALPVHLSPFRDAFVFTLVITILLMRPQGLLQRHSRRQIL